MSPAGDRPAGCPPRLPTTDGPPARGRQLRGFGVDLDRVAVPGIEIRVVPVTGARWRPLVEAVGPRAIHSADAQVLALARAQGPRAPVALVLTDDLALRRRLEAEGAVVVGSVGVLVRAYRSGLLRREELDPRSTRSSSRARSTSAAPSGPTCAASCPTFPESAARSARGATRHGARAVGAALLARAWCRVVPVRYLRRSRPLRSPGLPGDGPERAPRLPAGRRGQRCAPGRGPVSLTVGSEPRAVPHRRRGSTGERCPSAASTRPPGRPLRLEHTARRAVCGD